MSPTETKVNEWLRNSTGVNRRHIDLAFHVSGFRVQFRESYHDLSSGHGQSIESAISMALVYLPKYERLVADIRRMKVVKEVDELERQLNLKKLELKEFESE